MASPLNPSDIPEPIRDEIYRLILRFSREFVEQLFSLPKRLKGNTKKNFEEALTLLQQGRLHESLRLLNKCDQKEFAPEGLAILHLMKASILSDLGRLVESEAEATSALGAAAVGGGDEFLKSTALNQRGITRSHMGRLTRAEADFHESIAIAKRRKDKITEAGITSNLAAAYREGGKREESKKAAKRAQRIASTTNDPILKAASSGNLGNALRDSGDLAGALKQYTYSLKMARTAGERDYQAIALGNIGTVFRLKDELAAAEKHFKQALILHQETNNKREQANQLGNLAGLAADRKELKQAIDLLHSALTIHQQAGATTLVIQDHLNLARVWAMRSNQPKVNQHLERAQKIVRGFRPTQ
jgi:tetratricopeptide (TPR) repeat protein